MNAKHMVVSERIPLPARRLVNLVQQLLRVPHAQAARIVHEGGAVVNGRPTRIPHGMLEVGDRLEVLLAAEPERAPPEARRREKIRIIYQDDALVVVDKPAGLLTVPTPYRERHTLISALELLLGQDAGGGAVRDRSAAESRLFCVHRLDRGVSGLLVFARRLEIAVALRDQFEQRKPQRRYVALVAGTLRAEAGTFRSYLATDRHLQRYSTDEPGQGELAISHYRVLRSWSTMSGGDVTQVEVRLETGRRNQIRVHFAEAGHPVLGDPRYGAARARHPLWAHRRLALHAESLGFDHPVTRQPLEFQTRLPAEMLAFQQRAEPATSPRQGRRPRR